MSALLVAAAFSFAVANVVVYSRLKKQERATERAAEKQKSEMSFGFADGKDAGLVEYWQVALWLRKKVGINATAGWTAYPGPRQLFEELQQVMRLEQETDRIERELERRGRLIPSPEQEQRPAP